MKAGEIRRLSLDYTVAQLEAAVESIVEHEKDLIQVDGEDIGERLTNLNLALRVRQRVERSGEEHKHAFRSVMGSVRDLLTNEE